MITLFQILLRARSGSAWIMRVKRNKENPELTIKSGPSLRFCDWFTFSYAGLKVSIVSATNYRDLEAANRRRTFLTSYLSNKTEADTTTTTKLSLTSSSSSMSSKCKCDNWSTKITLVRPFLIYTFFIYYFVCEHAVRAVLFQRTKSRSISNRARGERTFLIDGSDVSER